VLGADKILVVDEGRIVESGTRPAARRGRPLRELYRTQFEKQAIGIEPQVAG